jgi:hypothetical protein
MSAHVACRLTYTPGEGGRPDGKKPLLYGDQLGLAGLVPIYRLSFIIPLHQKKKSLTLNPNYS